MVLLEELCFVLWFWRWLCRFYPLARPSQASGKSSASGTSAFISHHEGKFKRLRLRVHRNDIELNSINVVFGNGEVEHVKFEERIREGGEFPVINLKTPWNEGRYIREVEIHYHSRPDFRGEAIAELWGQEE